MNTQKDNTGQGEVTQKVVVVYPPERIEVKYTSAELELLLQQYEKELHKIDWSRLVTTAGLFLALIIPLITADFKSFPWLPGTTLQGFFLLATIVSGVFFVYFVVRNFYYLCARRPLNAHELIENKVTQMRKQLEEEYAKFKPSTFGGTRQDEPEESRIDKT